KHLLAVENKELKQKRRERRPSRIKPSGRASSQPATHANPDATLAVVRRVTATWAATDRLIPPPRDRVPLITYVNMIFGV
ncbi:hypothetical protein GWI33_011358, partial [Rhynchophorus ferrugineus]